MYISNTGRCYKQGQGAEVLEQKYISADTIYWVKERECGDAYVNVSVLAFL